MYNRANQFNPQRSKPQDTPLAMPSVKVGGPYAILSFVGSMVEGSNAQVPLDRVYTHHWIVEQSSHTNELCKTGLNYIFGIGAESRNSPAIFPEGHGYLIESEEVNKFGGNIHVLRTENLSTDALGMVPVGKAGAAGAAKQCNECYYAVGKGKQCTLAQNGTFFCCGDRCYDGSCGCPTKVGTKMVPVDFYLEYTVRYTRNVSMIKPVSVGVITTPNCEVFYNVLRNDDTPLTYSTTTFTNPAETSLYLAIGHQVRQQARQAAQDRAAAQAPPSPPLSHPPSPPHSPPPPVPPAAPAHWRAQR